MKKLLLFSVFLLCTGIVYPFGKNKVVYYTYEWKVMETDHFRIYLPVDNLFLSNEILSAAEEIYAHHSAAFGYSPKAKIKIILYNNQIDFQQNNIMDWTSPGTGGFTEFIKGRVVVPYSAFYPDFYHVISHEINHAFQGYRWGKGELNRFTLRDIDIPLWLVEGASEFNSIGLDRECEMIIADGLINGILPSLQELSDLYRLNPNNYFYVYKEGQIFYQFIYEKYGRDVYSRLNASIAENKTFDQVLTNFFSMTFDQLNSEFFNYLRKKYLPETASLSSVEMSAKKIMKEDTVFNMNPVSLDSNRIAFISDREIYPSILIYDESRNSLERIVKGGFDEDFLEFQYGKRNNLSVSTNGLLCFSSRSGGEDSLFLYSLKKKNTEKITLPFRIVSSPDISMDGNRIVFSAVQDQKAGIFIYDRPSKKTTQITGGGFYDNQPRFLGTNRIVFVSNRKNGCKSRNMDVFVYNIESGKFELVLDTSYSDEYPAVSKDQDKIAFIKNGVHPSLLIYSLNEKKLYEELVPTGGVFTPSFDEKGNILLTAYDKNRYNIYKYAPSFSKRLTNFYASGSYAQEAVETIPPYRFIAIQPYRTELSIDALFGGFAFNTSLGAAALGILQFSDLLGDDRYQLLLDTTIILNSSFLDYLNADFSYMSLKHRHNYGFRIFQYSNYFYELNTLQEFYNMERPYSKTYGGFVLYSYPFSTFDRIESQIGYRGFNFITNAVYDGSNIIYSYDYQNRNLLNLSYVHDSTLWDITGPIDGVRYEMTLSKAFQLYQNSINYEKLVLDFRSYFMILPALVSGYSFAFRAVGGKVFDTDKDKYPFYLGGFNSIRGYDLWSFQGDNMFLFNFELRVPFIYDWTIGFPFPLRMPTIWGVLFWDFGSAWNSDKGYEFFETRNSNLYFKDLKSGLGFGFRLVLLPAIKLMVNFAVPYDGSPLPSISAWQSFWLIGIDF